MKTADIYVGLVDDRKVQRAIRLAGDAALTAYLVVVLGSFRDERPARLADELPLWLDDRYDELLDVLVRVGLLDGDGQVTASAWSNHLEKPVAAADRKRERDRTRSSSGGQSSGDRQTTDRRPPDDRGAIASSRPVPSRPVKLLTRARRRRRSPRTRRGPTTAPPGTSSGRSPWRLATPIHRRARPTTTATTLTRHSGRSSGGPWRTTRRSSSAWSDVTPATGSTSWPASSRWNVASGPTSLRTTSSSTPIDHRAVRLRHPWPTSWRGAATVPNAGVLATHFTFHLSSADGAFTVRPEFCMTCGGIVRQVRERGLFRPDELVAHPDNPPTFGELMARLGKPLTPPERGLLDPTFHEMMLAAGYDADGVTQR